MIEKLSQEIDELKHKINKEFDVNKQIEMQRQLHIKKIELIDLVHEKDKIRAGLTARELINKVRNMPKSIRFETGISKIDSQFGGGFATGLFINLAGESGAGKTTLLLNILANMSQGRKTVFFNFEMGDRLFVKKLQELKLNDNQLDNFIIDSETNNLNELLIELELYAEEGIKFFAIDSKMKILNNNGEKEYQQISNMSRELSRLAARKDITIMLINQMNEDDIKHKRLAFKGSGDQKYDSDIALFVVVENGRRKLLCTKNRLNDKLFNVDIELSDYNNNPIVTEFNSSDNSFLNEIA